MFGSSNKIKIEPSLYNRLTEIARIGGYASTQEFILHVLDREAAQFEKAQNEDQVKMQLRGLGYIE